MATSSDKNEHRKRKGVSVAAAALSIALVAPLVQPTVTHRFTLAAESDNSVVSSETGSVSGSVYPYAVDRIELVDPQTGQRIELPMDDNGKLNLDQVPTGDYVVVVTPKDGYTAPANQTVTVNVGENSNLGDLTPQRQTGSITGSVAKVPEGTNLQVRATGNDDATRGVSKTVDVVDGSYSISDLPTGDYLVEVVAESVPEGYSVSGGQSATVTHNGTDTKNFEISSGRGQLTVNLTTDTPVEINAVHDGVTYAFGSRRNSFEWGAAPIGDYTVEVNVPEGYTVEGNTSVNVPEDGEAVVNVTVTRDKGSVSGSVDPKAVEKVELVDQKTQERHEVPMDGNGNLNLDQVPTGDYTVVVTPKDGYTAPVDQTVTVEKDQNTELENLDPTPVPTPTTSEQSTTSRPTPETTVTTSTPTPTTSLQLTPTSAELTTPTTSTQPTTLEPTPTTTIPLEVYKPTGSIVGKVINDKGNPLPSTDGAGNRTPSKVTVTDDKGNPVGDPVETDEKGEFTIPELPDGEYVVSVETPEGHNDPKPQVVVVTDGQPTEVPPFVSAGPHNAEFQPVYPVTYVRVGESSTSVTPNFTRLINGREFYRQPLRTAGVAKFEVADDRASLKDNGRVVFAAPQGAKPGDRFSVPVTVTYEDGTTDQTEAVFEAIQGELANAYDPKYEVGRNAAPGERVDVLQIGDRDLPEGTTFTLDRDHSNLNGWGIQVDETSGMIRAIAPQSREHRAEVAVIVSYSDGTEETITALVDPQDDTSLAATTPVQDAVVEIPVGVALDADVLPTLPDRTTVTVGDFSNQDWSVRIDDTGEATVFTTEKVKPNDSVVAPVVLTFPDGSTKTINVTLVAVESQANKAQPKYAGIDLVAGTSGTVRLEKGIEATYSLAGTAAGLRAVIDQATGEIVMSADAGAKTGARSIPVDVRYTDGSVERIQAPVNVTQAQTDTACGSSGSSTSSTSSTSSCAPGSSDSRSVIAIILGLLAAIGGAGWALYINQDAVRDALRNFGINI